MTTAWAPYKWVGGKRQLYSRIRERLPPTWEGHYIEPFWGSGVAFHNLAAENPELVQGAYVCDANPVVRAVTRRLTVEGSGSELIIKWAALQAEWNRSDPVTQCAFYAAWRDQVNDLSDLEGRMAVFLPLLYANHGGIWRENKKGEYNVPIGKVKEIPRRMSIPLSDLRRAADQLQRAQIRVGEDGLRLLAHGWGDGDVIYADPPYNPKSPTESFTGYAGGFPLENQIRLAKLLLTAANNGAWVVASNSDTPLVRQLYTEGDGWVLEQVYRGGSINSRLDKRERVGELLITRASQRS